MNNPLVIFSHQVSEELDNGRLGVPQSLSRLQSYRGSRGAKKYWSNAPASPPASCRSSITRRFSPHVSVDAVAVEVIMPVDQVAKIPLLKENQPLGGA